MITQELKQKSPTSSFVKGLIDQVMGNDSKYMPPALITSPDAKHTPLHKTWNKIAYARWIEQVKEKFKKGDWVTLKRYPIIMNYSPLAYEIVDIQEIHYEAIMDKERDIPCCIYAKILGTTTPKWMCPDDLRLLTDDEVLHAHPKPDAI